MASVLVTGSSGFLGGAIIPKLIALGHRIIGLDPLPVRDAPYRSIADDLSDRTRVERLLVEEQVSHIIHAGGISGPMVMPERPDHLMAVNVGGSATLLQAAIGAKASTFLYCSSVSAVGPYCEEKPIGTDHRPAPTDPYGCSKAAVDFVLQGLWRRIPLDLCSLRFTGIYGPGRRTTNVIDSLITAALASRPVQLPRQGNYPYVYIDDAANAAVAACFSKRRGDLIYYVAYPEQVSLDDLVNAIAHYAGSVSVEIDQTKIADPRGPVDIATSQRDFDFDPKIDHREGIRRMIETRRAGGRKSTI
jgi:nucleoside-diphosphate-sugar epimerase